MSYDFSPIISARDARAYLNEPAVIWVDARGGADGYQRYLAGHVDGAVFMDLEKDLSAIPADAAQGGRHPLPDLQTFAKVLGSFGITRGHHVIVYDDKAGANAAARLWWMLKAAGHDRVQVVDGGLDAIRAAGTQLAEGPVLPLPEGPYPVQEWKLPIADMATVDAARQNAEHLVIDVREKERYQGEREPIDLIAGHIPGAINLPYTDNLNATGEFRSAESLKEYFSRHLKDRSADRVIVHCGSGVTACHTILAMAHAGLSIPRLYVGSWSEWSRNPKPIGKQPGA